MPDDDGGPALIHAGSSQQLGHAAPLALVPGLAGTVPAFSEAATSHANGSAAGGLQAVTSHPLDRRGSRFMVFSAIGASIFLMGLGVQAVLTGGWHVPPVASFFIQGVISVETNFLLNRWLTWRDRGTPFWPACARFNAQRTVTIALNLVAYAGLIRLGMNYLIANIVLTAAFTAVNYLAGDRLVFIPGAAGRAEPAAPPAPVLVREHPRPEISVVIPCRGNESTIRAAVESLLGQDYPSLHEIILIGSPGDTTWDGLRGIVDADPRLTILEFGTPPGVRDANFKRDAGIRMTTGSLIALVDSDVVLPSDWMSRAVAALADSGASCVAGGIRSIRDDFWGGYTDHTYVGAKTPRITESYTVTSANFGIRGRKPPISANALFTRELYDRCPIDPSWSHGSYEDYEWFWRVAKAGYGILVYADLFGWHHHRRGLRTLAREYLRSSRGCAYFVRAHPDCPFARRRLRQAVILPLAAIAGAAGIAAAAAHGYSASVASLLVACLAALSLHQVARTLRPESVAYPVAGLVLGLVFTTGLVTHLIRSGATVTGTSSTQDAPPAPAPPDVPPAAVLPDVPPAPVRRLSWRRILHPLTAICALQAALSLTLVSRNTAFTDEADYLWLGRLLIAHWLHGTSWPSAYGEQNISGSPFIYPPLGAAADSVGGLAGARILSLAFMLGATVLLYLTASRLLGRTAAAFGAAIWVLTAPVLRLAFATYDPLSVLLTALSAWLVVQAGYRRRHGEFVAAAAAALALANATAYAGIVIDPVVIAFAFLIWVPRMGAQQAAHSAAWLTGGLVVFFSLLLTASHSWAGVLSSVINGNLAGHQGIPLSSLVNRNLAVHKSSLVILNAVWSYSGLVIVLAVIGAITAIGTERRPRAFLLALLAGAAFLVPAVQLHYQTTSSLGMHLAYGIWFAAMAAGYGCSKLIQRLPGAGQPAMALFCVLALFYPALTSWQSASQNYLGWADTRSFIASFKPVVAQSSGLIYASGQEHVAQYYTPQGREWARWNTGGLPLDPVAVRRSAWPSYYAARLRDGNYGVIALFYATNFSSVKLPGTILLSPSRPHIYEELLGLVGANSGEPGLPALTRALEQDPAYRLVSVGPFDSAHSYGIYAIWQKKAPE